LTPDNDDDEFDPAWQSRIDGIWYYHAME
jgi:hypothetical protein